MLTAKARKPRRIVGSDKPRIAPPVPARSGHKDFGDLAEKLGMPLRPWQTTVSRYLTATNPAGGWLYSEVATLAARQNGKTTVMLPLIIGRLLAGHRIVHTAQNRELPREMHEQVSELLVEHYPKLLPSRRAIRFGAGQETINLTTGGFYHIVAPSRGGARGMPHDLVIIDEVLEMTDMDFVGAAKPTTLASPHGQVVYFSNAGTPNSVVLHWLRDRADNDPSLAYLEWSAEPGLAPDDMKGWLQANPSIGHSPVLLPNLEREYRAHTLGGTLDVWEREHLCRQTLARHQSIVTPEEWATQQFVDESEPVRPTLGIKMDIGGERASAVLAWQESDERIGLHVVADVEGHPIDTDRLGPDLQRMAIRNRVSSVVYDPYTDADVARHLRRAKPLTGRDYASASEKFTRLVAGRKLLVQDDAGILASYLSATVPRSTSGGSYIAVKASPEVTNTAAEAAIRAAWLGSAPRPIGGARIY